MSWLGDGEVKYRFGFRGTRTDQKATTKRTDTTTLVYLVYFGEKSLEI